MIISIGFSIISYGQSYSEIIAEADKFYQEKKYKQSKENFEQAFELKDNNRSGLYRGGCSAALSGDKKTALKMLSKSVDNGWTNVRHMKKKSDLNSLHKDFG